MNVLIHCQTSTAQPLKFGNWQVISSHIYNGCDYLSLLGLRLIHVSKRGIRTKCSCSKWFNPFPPLIVCMRCIIQTIFTICLHIFTHSVIICSLCSLAHLPAFSGHGMTTSTTKFHLMDLSPADLVPFWAITCVTAASCRDTKVYMYKTKIVKNI